MHTPLSADQPKPHRAIKHFLWGLLACGLATYSASGFTAPVSYPGGVLAVNVQPGSTASFNGTPILVSGDLAVLGLGLKTRPGDYQLSITTPAGHGYEIEFKVEPKDYPEQHLTIKNDRKVNPYAQDLDRIRAESKAQREQYAQRSPARHDLVPFIQPTQGVVSSPFGRRRVLNGQPRNPHSGLDIAAPTGAAIVAPAPGIVTMTGDLFFNGNAVFVDHGAGLITMTCHMSEILVKEGQTVARGELLGKVGATGRVTGPHLHWNVSLNGVRVDPVMAMAALAGPEVAEPSPPTDQAPLSQ